MDPPGPPGGGIQRTKGVKNTAVATQEALQHSLAAHLDFYWALTLQLHRQVVQCENKIVCGIKTELVNCMLFLLTTRLIENFNFLPMCVFAFVHTLGLPFQKRSSKNKSNAAVQLSSVILNRPSIEYVLKKKTKGLLPSSRHQNRGQVLGPSF